ncbi:B-box zinc finger protein 32 [Prosopis cineraria]|uniref:B-box zinc finger protein 32 n=1 Tax=Prosopis cineraria TaxID=364024 RepID=UPI00240ED4A4|nr:B-box zinc finger protein 32 [Prosopis cineraria]
MKPRICELCNQEAYLYCDSDSAFLCWKCDAKVHDANFLVARHFREVLCCNCKCFAGRQVSGSVPPFEISTCPSCSPENHSDDDEDNDCLSSSSISACVSSTESCSTGQKKIQRRMEETAVSSSSVTNEKCTAEGKKDPGRCAAEEVFVNWSRKFGVNSNCVASLASQAVGKLMTVVPFRVAAATSFWFGLRYCGDGRLRTVQNLRKLEEMSKVPGKVIMAAEEKLTRVLRPKRARRDFEEGWAEC